MTRFLCQVVPCSVLAGALVLGGCFGSHGASGEDAGRPGRDAGPIPGDGGIPRADSGPRPRDAGPVPPDAGPRCSPADIDLSCFSHVSAGTPTAIRVAMGGEGCFCGEMVSCFAAVGSGTRTLELTTHMCVGDFLCDGCFPFIEGECRLPALAEGTWRVNVNGSYGFDLNVLPTGVLPERGETCIRRAARDDACGGVIAEPVSDRHGRVCHPLHAYPEQRIPITVTDGCGTCGALAGPCAVDVFDDVVRVRPTTVWSMCDYDCPAVCMPRDDVCWTPPLAPGEYQVVVDGIGGYTSTLEVTYDDPDPGEVCGPFETHPETDSTE